MRRTTAELAHFNEQPAALAAPFGVDLLVGETSSSAPLDGVSLR